MHLIICWHYRKLNNADLPVYVHQCRRVKTKHDIQEDYPANWWRLQGFVLKHVIDKWIRS